MKRTTRLLLRLFVSLAAPWAAWHERKICRIGTPLDPVFLADARALGIRHPEKVRVLFVERIPFFNGRFLRALSKFFPDISPHTIGLSLRYGIYLRKHLSVESHRLLLAHELVHTSQYEKCGGISAFLLRYFEECLTDGYARSPMEQEADLKSKSLS
ncbi:MAG: hypothetical protein QM680_06030 [Luteolibacter sp.]